MCTHFYLVLPSHEIGKFEYYYIDGGSGGGGGCECIRQTNGYKKMFIL